MNIGNNSQAQLRAFVERIEKLEQEKADLSEDIKSVYAESKSAGYDTKALRAVIKYRAQDAEKRAEMEALVETYLHALGSLADTPLGRSAVAREFGQPTQEART